MGYCTLMNAIAVSVFTMLSQIELIVCLDVHTLYTDTQNSIFKVHKVNTPPRDTRENLCVHFTSRGQKNVTKWSPAFSRLMALKVNQSWNMSLLKIYLCIYVTLWWYSRFVTRTHTVTDNFLWWFSIILVAIMTLN